MFFIKENSLTSDLFVAMNVCISRLFVDNNEVFFTSFSYNVFIQIEFLATFFMYFRRVLKKLSSRTANSEHNKSPRTHARSSKAWKSEKFFYRRIFRQRNFILDAIPPWPTPWARFWKQSRRASLFPSLSSITSENLFIQVFRITHGEAVDAAYSEGVYFFRPHFFRGWVVDGSRYRMLLCIL